MLRRRLALAATAAALSVPALLLPGAGAQGPEAAIEHLVVVPDTPAGRAALARTAAQPVARYDAFSLVEASGPDAEALAEAGGDVRDDMREVTLAGRAVDPATSRPALQAAMPRGRGLAVVQFAGPIKDAWLDRVRVTGVRLVTYMAQNAQLVAGTEAELRALADAGAKDPAVRAVTPYTAADKRPRALAQAGEQTMVVSTVAGADGDAARRAAAEAGRPAGDPVTIGAITQRRYTIPAARIDALTRDGGVVAVEPFAEPRPLDERAAQIVAGNLDSAFRPVLGAGYRSWLTGKGFPTASSILVDITDGGIDKGVVPAPPGRHPDFNQDGGATAPSRIRYAQEATELDTDARDCSGHGTNVASIAAGHNVVEDDGTTYEDLQNFNYGMGVAPYAKLGATKIFQCADGRFSVQTSMTALHGDAYAKGARISNNSWGADLGGVYETMAREIDALVRDARPAVPGSQPLVEVFAAGNSGPAVDSIDTPGTAKNVITVGASESVRRIGRLDGCGTGDDGADSARDIIRFSGRGPTDDLRQKPDVVAPGTHLVGARPQTADFTGSSSCNKTFPIGSDNTLYTLSSGTSQATPEVTGLAANVFNWYARTRGRQPSPAMTKALIVNGTTDLAGGDDGAGRVNGTVPTPAQGWGRVNLGNLVDGTTRHTVDQSHVLGASGQAQNRYYGVVDPARPVRITLAFTDAPGPTTGNAYVNDLDLEVAAGGEAIYKGNVLAGGRSVAGGSADPRNTVESVLLPPGTKGPLQVRVIARSVGGDGVPGNEDATDQDYALVVGNARLKDTAVMVPTDRPFADYSTDKDGHVEPGEAFGFRQKLLNRGNLRATGISGALTSQAATVQLTDASAAWPDLAPGAGALGDELRVGVGRSHRCGAPVDLKLTVRSSAGPLVLPITVPTGGPPGPASSASSPDVPKSIPSGSTTGVTSTLVLPPEAGAVADLDVALGLLKHENTMDLTITLTAPGGPTVTLFDRRQWAGRDLVDTVFDDEAAKAIADGAAPFTGPHRPEQPLSAFDGRDASGTWTLKVVDKWPTTWGTLESWGLTRRDMVCG